MGKSMRAGRCAGMSRLAPSKVFVQALAVALLLSATPAAASIRFAGAPGIGYRFPIDSGLADLYGSAPSLHAAGEVLIEPLPFSTAVEVGYSWSKCDHAGAPFFVASAESKLQLVPIEILFRLPLRDGPLAPHAGVGLELLWIKESFRYKLLGEQGDRDAAGSLHPGLVLVAGAQRNRSPKLRLEGYASIVSAKKKVTRGETYEPSNAEKVNAGSLGLRIYWRLP
ncbi:MAG: hypothetical protein FJY88_04615 [Candidatus Eisenbacteria bacterium]|nr:hypothetical protein [Candidatus Eisenbacteria bacterium]